MTSFGRHAGITSLKLALAGTAILCLINSQAASHQLTPALQALVPAAEKEGHINISWTAMGFNKGADRFEKGFNAYYGTHIKFDYTPGLAFGAAQRRLADELAAGEPAFRDLSLIAGAPQVQFAVQRKMDRQINWAPLLPTIPKGLLKKVVSPDGTMVRFISQPGTIMYNTNIIKPKDSPKTLADLLNPKWKGMIASTPYVFGWEDLPLHPLWGEAKALDYMEKLAPQLAGLIRCADLDRIASGEFPIFAITCEPGLIRQLKDTGAPVDQNIPLDWRFVYYWWFGVPKNAQNPATAILFIAWIMTPEGQSVLWQNEGSDLHLLPTSRNKEQFERTEKAAGGPMYEFTLDQMLNYNEDAYRAKILALFRGGQK